MFTMPGSRISRRMVTIVNGQSGNLRSFFAPQGRLTLQTGTPVMSSTTSGSTTVYYTPYAGNTVPLYNGAFMVPTVFTEVSQLTTDTTKSPAAVAASSAYDMFGWNDSGKFRVTRGPAWSTTATRGYTLTMVQGILLNTSAITNGPAALRGTYLGSICSNAGSTIDYIFGAAASGGTAASLLVWNCYNRVLTSTTVTDSGATYTLSSGSFRQARASAGNQILFLIGLQEDSINVKYGTRMQLLAVSQAAVLWGIGFDSTTTPTLPLGVGQTSAAVSITVGGTNSGVWNSGIGLHGVYALEASDGTNLNTFNLGTNNQLMAVVRN